MRVETIPIHRPVGALAFDNELAALLLYQIGFRDLSAAAVAQLGKALQQRTEARRQLFQDWACACRNVELSARRGLGAVNRALPALAALVQRMYEQEAGSIVVGGGAAVAPDLLVNAPNKKDNQ